MLDLELKKAQTTLSIHPFIENRWSPRAFSDHPVTYDQLNRIFEAARWAPSSGNEQPWRFIAGFKGDNTYEKIYNCLDDGNQLWANNAAVLMINITKKHYTANGEYNDHQAYDLGQAMAYITFQAAAEGLYTHQMGGFYLQKAIEIFNIPDEFVPMSCAAIGYLGNPEMLNEFNEKRERAVRHRRKLAETVFKNKWDESMF
jgi:nitroreductase